MFSKRFSALWLRMAVLALVASFILLNRSQPASAQTSGISPMTTPHENVLLSVTSTGAQTNNTSSSPKASANGAVVVFTSTATNLVANDTNGYQDVFTYDRFTRTTECLTCISLVDELPTNNHSWNPDISEDGQYVVFASDASNLVESDLNGVRDIFIYDRYTQTLEKLVTSQGESSHASDYPVISADGQVVAFESLASNWVSGDTNAQIDVFAYNYLAEGAAVQRVSVDSNGNQLNEASLRPSISADGKKVAFLSYGVITTADNNTHADIYVRDRSLVDAVQLVSIHSNGTVGNSSSLWPSLSEDGNFVVFHSTATNLVDGDTNNQADIFMRNLLTNSTTRVSVGTGGVQGDGDSAAVMDVSKYGQFVVFSSSSSNLTAGDTNGFYDIFIHEVTTGETKVISSSDTGVLGNEASNAVVLAAGETPVAIFTSTASNLVASDTNGQQDLFAYVLKTIIPETTTVLTETSTQHLTSVSESGNVFTFAQNSSELSDLAPGDVMVMGISTHTPDGALRKVVSVNTSGNQVIVNTVPGRLTDAITQGEAHHAEAISFENVGQTPQLPGVETIISPDNLTIEIVFRDLEVPNTSITLNGTIEVTPSTDFDLIFLNGDLHQMSFVLKAEQKTEITFSSEGGFELEDLEWPFIVPTIQLPPVTIMMGYMPLIFKPTLDVVGGLEGSLNLGISVTSVVQQANIRTGIVYNEYSGWDIFGNFNNTFGAEEPEEVISLTGEIEPYGGVQFRFMLYGFAGPYAHVYRYVRAEFGITSQEPHSFYTLSAGLKVPMGFSMASITDEVTDYEALAIDFNYVISEYPEEVDVNGIFGNQDSLNPMLSSTGQYIVFDSYAYDLVPDDGVERDVFLYDRLADVVTKIPQGINGARANGPSFNADISGDGNYIVFESRASNLVPNDTNGVADIFLYNRSVTPPTTQRISVPAAGGQANGISSKVTISDNGQFVLFVSTANNLVPNDTNSADDIFLYNVATGSLQIVSLNEGNQQVTGISFNGGPLSISEDGRCIVFTTNKPLASTDVKSASDVYLRCFSGLGQGITQISANSNNAVTNTSRTRSRQAVSADGKKVIFQEMTSEGPSLVVHNIETGTRLVMTMPSNSTYSDNYIIAPDGQSFFYSTREPIPPISPLASWQPWYQDNNDAHDLLKCSLTGPVQCSFVASTWYAYGFPNEGTWSPTVSADGNIVAVVSNSTNIVTDTVNGKDQIYFYNLEE